MNRHAVRMLLVVASFAIALNALAVTEMQVAAAAADLKSDYLELEPRVEAGTESHALLEAEFDALEARRVSLEADRATLTCSCQMIDATIAEINASADYQRGIIVIWE